MARTNFLRGAARRTFASALTAALLLSGTAFAPITAKAATSGGATQHYQFRAVHGDTDKEDLTKNNPANKGKGLSSNITIGANATSKTPEISYGDGQLALPDGIREVGTFVMTGSASAVASTAADAAKEENRAGVPARVITDSGTGNTGSEEEGAGATEDTGFAIAPTENLKIYLDGMEPLDTTNIAAANVSILYGFAMASNHADNNVAEDRVLQVRVSLDGETWLEDSVGIRSATLLGGNSLSAAAGTPGLFYRIETENLLDIKDDNDESIQGRTIQNIMVMPHGESMRAIGSVAIGELTVNTYETVPEFDKCVPADKIEYYEEEYGETLEERIQTLRALTVEEAQYTAQIPWTTDQKVETKVNGKTLTYYSVYTGYSGTNTLPHRGPTYERVVDSTRELFQSRIDENGKWTSPYSMSDTDTNEVYGMDCQTFVFNAISRVSRTWAWACLNTINAPYTSIVGDHLTVRDHPYHTDKDITDLNSEQEMYWAYAQAQPGDIVDYYSFKGSHTRVVVEVYPDYDDMGAGNGHFNKVDDDTYVWAGEGQGQYDLNDESYMMIAESGSKPRYYFKDNSTGDTVFTETHSEYSGDSDFTMLYQGSAHDYHKVRFFKLLESAYVPFTLDEYKTGKVEKERVQVVFGSKEAGQNFVNGGLNMAISSNYRIISYQVKLENLDTKEVLYNPDLVYTMKGMEQSLNYSDSVLNQKLRDLARGNYRITLTVDSGPLTELGSHTVPQTVKTVDFTVVDETRPTLGPEDLTEGDVVFIPGEFYKDKIVYAYLVASGDGTKQVGQAFFVDNTANQLYSPSKGRWVGKERGHFWQAYYNDASVLKLKHITIDSTAFAKYKFGYHDKIQSLGDQNSTVTLANATGHTSPCSSRFYYSCSASNGCKLQTALQCAADLKIIDLRTDVIAGRVDKVSDLAQVKQLTDQENAVVNTYVPDGKTSGGTASVIIVVDHSIVNSFAADYDVTAEATDNGTILVNGASTIYDVPAGEEVTVTAKNVTSGYELGTVYVDGEAIEGTTFIIRGNHTVTADFVEVCAHANTEVLPAVEPTCKQTGLTAGKRCLDCQEILLEQTVLPVDPENHTEVAVPGTPPTANTPGWTDGIWCSECETWIQEQTEIEATGCSVTVTSVEGNGTVTLNKAGDEYAYGETAIVSAIPNGHYTTEDLSDDEDTTPFISVTAESDYELSQLLVDGADVTAQVRNGIYTFEVIGNHTVEAVFKEKGEQEPEGKLAFAKASLELQNSLAINYKVEETLFTTGGYSNPYAVFELDDVETEVRDYTVVDGNYVFSFRNIAPHMMNENIKATLYAERDGELCTSTTVSYSVSTYCYNQLEKYSNDEQLRTLLVDLLNYGAAAQMYTGRNTDALVNAKLTEDQAAWGTDEMRELKDAYALEVTIGNAAAAWKSAGLILEDSVVMRFKFEAENTDSLTVKIVSGEEQWEISSSEFVPVEDETDLYYVYFDGLYAQQMSQTVKATIYDAAWNAVSQTLCYSIETYAHNKQNDEDVKLAELVKRMMCYGDAVCAYAQGKEN